MVALFYWLLEPLRELLARLKNAKWRDIELQFEFKLGVEQLKALTPNLPQLPEEQPLPQVSPEAENRTADLSPNRAVIQAWTALELAAKRLLNDKGRSDDPKNILKGLIEFVESKELDGAWVSTYQKLRDLHHIAVITVVPESDADSFIEVASIVKRAFRVVGAAKSE